MNHLLLVEDEIVVRMVAREVLEDGGFSVLEAGTGDEAIRLLDSLDSLDLIVTDVRMPGSTDGVDVASHAQGRFPNVQIIVTTGYAANIKERLKQCAPRAILMEKPYGLSRISALAKSLSRSY